MYKDLKKKKAWLKKNKKKMQKYRRMYYWKNPKKFREKIAKWRKENPEKYKAQSERYYKKNKGRLKRFNKTIKGRFISLKAQANKRNLKVLFTLEQYALIISQPCFYCGGPLNKTGSGLDRKLNKGNYSLNNVVPCCKNCNVMKNTFLTFNEMVVAMKAVLKLRKTKPQQQSKTIPIILNKSIQTEKKAIVLLQQRIRILELMIKKLRLKLKGKK